MKETLFVQVGEINKMVEAINLLLALAVVLFVVSLVTLYKGKKDVSKFSLVLAIASILVCVGVSQSVDKKAYNLVKENSLVFVSSYDKEISKAEFDIKYNGADHNFEAEPHAFVKSTPILNSDLELENQYVYKKAIRRNNVFKKQYYVTSKNDEKSYKKLDKDSKFVKAQLIIGELTGFYI